MRTHLEIGFLLDRRWHALRGEMDASKKTALVALARILAEAKTPYAVIGGVALQIHQREPRTTLDVGIAVCDRSQIPARQLETEGFVETGRFAHSENWRGPDETPVQFTDDPALAGAVARAASIDLDGIPLRVIGPADLLHEKLRAGSDPAGRRSKRLQDLADVAALLEQDPELDAELTDAERAVLATLPR